MDQDQILWVKIKYFLLANVLRKRFSLFEELSHRSSTFAKIIQDAERDIREIL